MFRISEVSGIASAELLHKLNAQAPERFPPLQDRHMRHGFWWIAYNETSEPIAFAGMVPMKPFEHCYYLKRCYVAPEARGHGLQVKFLKLREVKAAEIGCRQLVSECESNPHSETNFIKCGFEKCDPEQPWGAPGSVYFAKWVIPRRS